MLRLISWNVRYFSHATRGITSSDRTIRRIAATIAQMDPQPDVIALQEVDDFSVRSSGGRTRIRDRAGIPRSQLDRFMHALNDASLEAGGHVFQEQFYPAMGHARSLPLISTGLAIIYRHTLEQVDNNGGSPHDITHRRIRRLAKVKQTRICAWSRFRVADGREFDIYNTHLSLPAFLQRHKGQTKGRFGEADNQVREVASALDFMSGRQARPRILVGDFNAVPGSKVYYRALEDLIDAHAVFLDRPEKEMRHFPTAGFANLRFRLDHVFRSPDIKPVSFKGTKPYGRAHPLATLSDHTPIIMEFELPPADG